MGAHGRSSDYLSRSLSIPVESINQLARTVQADGLITSVTAHEQAGYIMTQAGARHFAPRILAVPTGVIDKTLSATAVEALVVTFGDMHAVLG